MRKTLSVWFLLLFFSASCAARPPLSLPSETFAILDATYSGRVDQAVLQAIQLQQQTPQHPLGYLLEAEARWWTIYCSSAEYKYGMTMARHREKLPEDQSYLDLSAQALAIAEARLREKETAEMQLYAGLANALASRLYGLRWDTRNTARAGVRAREHFQKAITLDPSLADADMGLGLYNYYVDTLSTMTRVLRFFMGIPGGSKQDGIRLLHQAIDHGQLTPSLARFYLAIDLHNYDQKYEEALEVLEPLVERYPQNPIFQLSRGDLYAKLGQKDQALVSYRAAADGTFSDAGCLKHMQLLARQSTAELQK